MTRPNVPTRTIAYASILVVLVAVFVAQEATGSRRNTVALPDLPETIDRVVLEEREAKLELDRDGPEWIVGANAYPAQAQSVSELLEPLRSLREADVVSTREGWNQFGLDAGARRTITYYADGEEVAVVDLGDRASAGDQVYGRIDRGVAIVLLPGALAGGFSTDGGDFRPSEIVDLAPDEVLSLAVESPEGPSVVAHRGGRVAEGAGDAGDGESAAGPAPGWEIDSNLEVDAAAVDALVSALGPLRADGFPDAEPSGEPFATVVVDRATGERIILSLWPPNDEGSYPARASSYDYPFLVSDWRARRLLLQIDAYFDAFEPVDAAE